MTRRIQARFVPQAWIRAYAVDIDGTVEFDCTDQIVQMGKEAALQIRDDQYESEDLVPSEIRDRHSGPFRVEVQAAIQAYFAEGESPS